MGHNVDFSSERHLLIQIHLNVVPTLVKMEHSALTMRGRSYVAVQVDGADLSVIRVKF